MGQFGTATVYFSYKLGECMASINKRDPKQWQVKIRRAGYPTETAIFKTRKKAEEWARSVERDMDKGGYMDTIEAPSQQL